MNKFSYLVGPNADYIDEIFARYLSDPTSVDETWRYLFEGLELGSNGGARQNGIDGAHSSGVLSLEPNVAELITAYRERGRLLAKLNPLEPAPASHPLLELAKFGLSNGDLDKRFTAGKLIKLGPAPLKDIIARCRQIYCSSIGVEYSHIQDPVARSWLEEKLETTSNLEILDPATRKRILQRLTDSEAFEQFLHTRYVAQKRFSIEGGEALIPVLDRIIETSGDLGANNMVFGMAHRGRLNVLTNIFGKPYEHILSEFEQAYQTDDATAAEGDVKYHMGYSTDVTTPNGKKIHLSLANNPSHLEFVNPVVEGIARSKQRNLNDVERSQVIPLLIHGDAAFAGQGVVYETLMLSQLGGFWTGGTIHIVIDNQIGFTTDPKDSRSTAYSTDVAKMLEVPIFHVNGDDPEALWYIARLVTEYRQIFKKDVFIELNCYRRYGHNEGDEPLFTQPLLYKKIKAHPSPRKVYADKLVGLGVLSDSDVKEMYDKKMAELSEAQLKTRRDKPKPEHSKYQSRWQKMRAPTDADIFKKVTTRVGKDRLLALSEKLNKLPVGFAVNSKIKKGFDQRQKAVASGKNLDWGNCEILAYATLLEDGFPIRLSGQDVERGTFSHRQAVLHDMETGDTYTPLAHIEKRQGDFIVQNSALSETAVLGFEYGWSLADPDALVIWEAQFGDFANGAQVIIDQFIAASESKWQRATGIVLYLPHGYEGQGSEHSSARLERFLQLSGKNNLAVCNFTTPAQLFHALRRQMKREFRKPMIIMTPKSLLRHPEAVSDLEDLSLGEFYEILDDPIINDVETAKTIERILLCSGKIYYEITKDLKAANINHIAVVRIEQLYPWPAVQLHEIISKYPKEADIIWVQEEPKNMGAWAFIHLCWSGGFSKKFIDLVEGRTIQYIGRERGAASAVGSMKVHQRDQKEIVRKALGL